MADSAMDGQVNAEDTTQSTTPNNSSQSNQTPPTVKGKNKNRSQDKDGMTSIKRRCVSTACMACRRRKSKCDGNTPKCAACASVYLTECEYAPHTDHRRKGVYKKDIDTLKTRNSTLQTLIQAILNYDEEDVPELVRQIRTCDNLEDLAENIVAKEKGLVGQETPDSPIYNDPNATDVPRFDAELSSKMGDLWLDGSVKFIGGTSNLIWLPQEAESADASLSPSSTRDIVRPREEAILSWTTVTQDKDLILHFINMYFCWHYPYFTTLSKELFYRDFLQGLPSQYCSALLVNVMLALGCHFSSRPAARADSEDSGTTGDHYFVEAKRLMALDDEFANAKLCTVQALALMSVREAGCGRESKGWVYSGMSFRMACDLGLNLDAPAISESSKLRDEDVDARRITFWGCFLFDKCWSNYLGRQPQLQINNITVKRPDVFPSEDSEMWSPYTDSGIIHQNVQPARTRAVALQISKLAEISSELLVSFYHPTQLDKPAGKQAELKKLSDLHTRLEAWKRDLPAEFEPKDGQLPQVLLMHMFFQLLFIHLYRPFLKYTRTTSPLPSHVSPRKFCTQAAGAISKLFRLYKRTHGLRQICNIAVYIAHSACTIHLLNLPDKNARRDIIHGVKHLEEIGECWTCARRTLRLLSLCAEKWQVELPDEAVASFARARVRWGMSETTAISPVSATTMMDISNQTNVLPEIMARNVQHVAPAPVAQSRQQAPQSLPQAQKKPAVTHLQNGLSTGMIQSPTFSEDARRSSGGYSLPPQSAAELARQFSNIKPSIHLTKAQQDAWNAHQASRHMNTAQRAHNKPGKNSPGGANAAVLFGGVDSLVEESHDWWLRDQSTLAQGFENWVDPNIDWNSIEAEMNLAAGAGGSGQGSLNGYQAYSGNVLQNGGFPAFPSNTLALKQEDSGGGGRGVQQHIPQFKGNGFDDEMYF